MKTKLVMATATALSALMSGAALGGNNFTHLYQDGDYNTLLATQDGVSNGIGKPSAPVTQDGHYNSIVFSQTASDAAPSGHGRNRNEIGFNGSNLGLGVDQIGSRNVLEITQSTTTTNWPNVVNEVQQAAAIFAGALTNRAILLQAAGAGNSFVGKVHQTNTGNGTDALTANNLTIDQTGTHNVGRHSNVANFGGVFQYGVANTVDIDQVGSGQAIYTVNQAGSGHVAEIDMSGDRNRLQLLQQAGSEHTASIELSGKFNGVAGTDSQDTGTLVNASALPDVLASSIIQFGAENRLDAQFSGQSNQYGFYQNGINNRAQGVVVSGNNNSLGVRQHGEDNDFDLGVISGHDNVLGLNQAGDANFATIEISGDGNGDGAFSGRFTPAAAGTNLSGLISQVGNENDVDFSVSTNQNEFSLTQLGNKNLLVASIDSGNLNQLVVLQNHTGGAGQNDADIAIDGASNNVAVTQNKPSNNRNVELDLMIEGNSNNLNVVQGNNSNALDTTAIVSITGDFNNSLTSFTGAADTALASHSNRVAGTGQIKQGTGSTLEYALEGNNNRFALYQGSASSIVGSTKGSDNQVVVNQGGNANVASFTQIGSFNNLGVQQ